MFESTLHHQLKNYYTHPEDMQEAWVDGYLVDVLQSDRLIEIQTRNFLAIRPKLLALLPNHKVLLVHPIPAEKWIIRQDGERQTRRLSPRRGRLEDLFFELIRFPQLMEHPNLTLEIIMIQMEEIRRNDGKGSWRRNGWSIADRKLLNIKRQVQYDSPTDFRGLLPKMLRTPFTVRDLADQSGISINLAQKMAYCLKGMGQLQTEGKKGRAQLYALPDLIKD